jgi:alkaline phosphatase D
LLFSGGFSAERAAIIDVAKNNANNAIILAGDVHDGWAWTLYDGGVVGPGEPVAVNLVCPAVTSPGWGPLVLSTFQPLEEMLGTSGIVDLANGIFEAHNPGLVYAAIEAKGFTVVKMTQVSQTCFVCFQFIRSLISEAADRANHRILPCQPGEYLAQLQ